jgi:hypoxanthine phosphoribosyltransferase
MVGMGTESEADVEHAPGGERQRPAFAHPSESEFASILDFYQLAWEYEPRTFPLRHGADGRVIESFSPDFYLPELDLYIELTTLKQSLVTKKNRKLRRLRELYPEIKIKLLYNRDYRNLLFKYGLQVHGPQPAAPAAPPAGPAPAPAETAP